MVGALLLAFLRMLSSPFSFFTSDSKFTFIICLFVSNSLDYSDDFGGLGVFELLETDGADGVFELDEDDGADGVELLGVSEELYYILDSDFGGALSYSLQVLNLDMLISLLLLTNLANGAVFCD